MKGIIIALFAILACVAAGVDRPERRPPCPRDNSIEVYQPDRNCNRFWQCSNGVAILRRCPKGLSFNARKEVCDYPRRARCNGEGWEALPKCKLERWIPECRGKSENIEFEEYLEEDLD